ncbi:MAG TPA: hypothetical protein VFO41_08365 [Alphaproteobacteria bacterium]|nr:hypothetical protein [Alphaproteobacteria bacterium]
MPEDDLTTNNQAGADSLDDGQTTVLQDVQDIPPATEDQTVDDDPADDDADDQGIGDDPAFDDDGIGDDGVDDDGIDDDGIDDDPTADDGATDDGTTDDGPTDDDNENGAGPFDLSQFFDDGERLQPTGGDDLLIGRAGDFTISGRGGNDLLIAGEGGAAPDTEAGTVYRAELTDQNESGVTGAALLTLGDDDNLTVQVTAAGLEPDQVHAQHIHGLFGEADGTDDTDGDDTTGDDTAGDDVTDGGENGDGENGGDDAPGAGEPVDSTIPTPEQDADGDGFVELAEAATTNGPAILPLTSPPGGDPSGFPTAPGGTVAFEETYDLTDPSIFAEGFDADDLTPLDLRVVELHGLTVGEDATDDGATDDTDDGTDDANGTDDGADDTDGTGDDGTDDGASATASAEAVASNNGVDASASADDDADDTDGSDDSDDGIDDGVDDDGTDGTDGEPQEIPGAGTEGEVDGTAGYKNVLPVAAGEIEEVSEEDLATLGVTLDGGRGHDTLIGGAKDDWLFGGTGSDRLAAGDGDDTSVGGAGADLFAFSGGNDTILDFNFDEGDRIRLDNDVDVETAVASATEDENGVTFSFEDGDALNLAGVSLDQFSTDALIA